MFFDHFDQAFQRVLPLETLLKQVPTELKETMKRFYYQIDRESKGFITYWDVFQGFTLCIFLIK